MTQFEQIARVLLEGGVQFIAALQALLEERQKPQTPGSA